MTDFIWVPLPVDDESAVPALYDGDSYLVRRTNGEELWANCSMQHGVWFVPCDDDGEPIGTALDDVAAVQVPSYALRAAVARRFEFASD